MRVYKIDILNTPPDPRLVVLFTLLLGIFVQVSAQDSGELVSDEAVQIAINEKYDSLAKRELFDEDRVKRYRFLNFLPSPGYSLLQGPTVSYNLGSIFRFFETRERHRVEKERIVNDYQEKAEEEFGDYVLMREQVEELRDELEVQKQILELERKLFAIAEAKYENHEVTPTEYIQEEITFRRKELTYAKKREKLNRSERRLSEYYQKRKIYYADRY
jgi:hypothetical protein